MRVEVKERWQRTWLKWKQISTKNFRTNCPHIDTWTFQIHLVILPANSLQLIKCFRVCFPFFAGCEPWTSISHPGCCWRLKKSLLDLSFLQAPPVDRYTPWCMGLRTVCVFACALSLLHGARSRHREQLPLLSAGKSSLFCTIYCPSHWEATATSKHSLKTLRAT